MARVALENNLQSKAVADRETVLGLLEDGYSHEEAVETFKTEENFNGWLETFTALLNETGRN